MSGHITVLHLWLGFTLILIFLHAFNTENIGTAKILWVLQELTSVKQSMFVIDNNLYYRNTGKKALL
jgi:hypothetical protein